MYQIDDSSIIENNDEALALAILLADNVLFYNNAKLSTPKNDNWNTVLYVFCSDVFVWACADAESISNSDGDEGSEIIELYKLWKENKKYGAVKWACLKRNMQPQKPLKKQMITDGYWDEQLENLPKNEYDD